MMKSMACKAAVFLTSAAAVLLSACNGEEAKETGGAGSAILTAPRDTTVVFHMTGLVLIVPPKSQGAPAEVLLPTDAGHDVAWLGLGMGGDSADYVGDLCEGSGWGDSARAKGICYVDLHDWKLQPFGAGGQRTDTANLLPPGVVNVTRGSGGLHRVAIPLIAGRYDARLTFLAGKPGARPCILASWLYQAVGEPTPQRLDMVNVLDWEIEKPARLELIFRQAGTSRMDTVPLLPPDPLGRIELLLAHIPQQEVPDLPPGRPRNPPAARDTAFHFDAFYDLVTIQNPVPTSPAAGSRPLPHRPLTTPARRCVVGITTAPSDKGFIFEPRALGTYACMVASAEGA